MIDDPKPNPASMDAPVGDGTHNPMDAPYADQRDHGDETTAQETQSAPEPELVDPDGPEGGPVGEPDKTLLGRLRTALAELEEFAGYEADMARVKLTEAIHWLGIHTGL